MLGPEAGAGNSLLEQLLKDERIKISTWLRGLRGWCYRSFPAGSKKTFVKKLAGFERRWELEKKGFTKHGFFTVFREKIGLDQTSGLYIEAPAGDGRVGSLSGWLEASSPGWNVKVWEHRPEVLKRFRNHRPSTEIHHGRLTRWEDLSPKSDVKAVTVRGVREAAGLCREIRRGKIRPVWLGIWNPTRRPIWYRRMKNEGYQLQLVWQNMEFYRRRNS